MKILFSIALLGLLISCKKDKTPAPCIGVSMTGDRELFVGTWRWYSTTVKQWFDIGPPNYLEYTPQNQGFEYYFTISSEGLFKGYRNDTLVHDHILDSVEYEIFNGTNVNNMLLSLDCTQNNLDLRQLVINVTDDTIHSTVYPLQFNDQENHLISIRNYFVKE